MSYSLHYTLCTEHYTVEAVGWHRLDIKGVCFSATDVPPPLPSTLYYNPSRAMYCRGTDYLSICWCGVNYLSIYVRGTRVLRHRLDVKGVCFSATDVRPPRTQNSQTETLF